MLCRHGVRLRSRPHRVPRGAGSDRVVTMVAARSTALGATRACWRRRSLGQGGPDDPDDSGFPDEAATAAWYE